MEKLRRDDNSLSNHENTEEYDLPKKYQEVPWLHTRVSAERHKVDSVNEVKHKSHLEEMTNVK